MALLLWLFMALFIPFCPKGARSWLFSHLSLSSERRFAFLLLFRSAAFLLFPIPSFD
jgi:hypothetical protein